MRSFTSRIGGKSRLAPFIVKQFPKHKTYVEPFGGAACVLFTKEPGTEVEVYNDIDKNLVNLFRVVKHRPAELVERLDFVLYSRETHKEFIKQMKEGNGDELDRAAMFYHLVKSSFSATPFKGWGYSRTVKAKKIRNLDFLKEAQDRLERVYIECQPWQDILSVFDTPETLFYLDPPYLMEGKYYEHDLDLDGHVSLCQHLGKIKGKFLLSLNDCQETRNIYKGFDIMKTPEIHYSLDKVNAKPPIIKSEIVIRNF